MGLLETLKNAKNFITGGGVKVSVEITTPKLKSPFKVKVKAEVGDADTPITGVLLLIKSVEKVDVQGIKVVPPGVTRLPPYPDKNIHVETVLYQDKIVLTSNPARLKSKEIYEWFTEVSLSDKAQAVFGGKHAKHLWFVMAELQVAGNNPDSGWISFDPA